MKRIRLYQLIFLLLMISSCEDSFDFHKDEKYIVCKSTNCYSITINGKIRDRVKNTGIKGIPVTFRWVKPQCWFCPENIIDKKTTNNLGEFSFNSSIDTSLLSQRYDLFLSIQDYPEYIIFPYDRQFSFYDLKDSSLNNLIFDFYPKANLQIEIERTEKDTFDYFSIEHSFRENYSYVDYIISSVDPKETRVLNAETASDIKTYIKWGKTFKSKHIDFRDSIICVKGKINTYKIKY